ncbi:hypothetical protein E8E13_009459 [Curvularia kusanoi]|uniref:MYND-type domain-containing protein n=1 Tax=Curvularia kusanoi TaxID=90978 RepID=A0A9P4TGR4_CURKU|nr:hypothetical protein E8E13_009459 [Curvularia kusanoi]
MGCWGYGLFQSDNDFDTLSELGSDMGLDELEDKLRHAAKVVGESDEKTDKIYLSIYGGGTHPEIVRDHLDSGALAELIKVKEAKMMAIPDGSMDQKMEFMFRDPCYEYVLLGACAMSLGCQLPRSFLDMLKLVYTEFSRMPDARKQMHKALFGPDGFKNGEPYDFESMSLVETANAKHVDDGGSSGRGFVGLNVMPPGGLLSTGVGDSTESAILKELRNKFHNPNVCARCSADHAKGGGELLQCARCKDRKYCSSACQKQHWKMIHKKLCKPIVT